MNPEWKMGMQAVNPKGRPKYSVQTPQGLIERFLKRVISPQKLMELYNRLTPHQKSEMITQMLPYVMPKKQADSLSSQEVDALYEKLEQAMQVQHKPSWFANETISNEAKAV